MLLVAVASGLALGQGCCLPMKLSPRWEQLAQPWHGRPGQALAQCGDAMQDPSTGLKAAMEPCGARGALRVMIFSHDIHPLPLHLSPLIPGCPDPNLPNGFLKGTAGTGR